MKNCNFLKFEPIPFEKKLISIIIKFYKKIHKKKIVLEIDKHLRSVNEQTMLQLRNKEILQNCGLLQLDMN